MNAAAKDRRRPCPPMQRIPRTREGFLTKEREALLVAGMAQGSEADRHELVLAHAPLAYNMAVKVQGRGSAAHAHVEDLFSQAMIGLLIATSSFDPAKSRFSTYGRLCIRSMLIVQIDRRHTPFSLPNHRKFATVFRRMAAMRARMGVFDRPLTAREAETIAKEFRLPDEMDVFAIDRASDPDARIDIATTTGSEPWLVDPDAEDPFEAVADERMRKRTAQTIRRAMALLSPRERMIVEGVHLSDPPAKLRELAEVEGVSHQRIQQISDNALDKLRRFVRRMDPDLVRSAFPSRNEETTGSARIDELHPEDRVVVSMMQGRSRELLLLRIGAFERWISEGQVFKAAERHAEPLDLSKGHFVKLARQWKTRRRIADLTERQGTIPSGMRRGRRTDEIMRGGEDVLRAMVERGRILRELHPERTETSIYREVSRGMSRPPSSSSFHLGMAKMGVPKRANLRRGGNRPMDGELRA